MQRLFDILLSGIALVLLSPLLILVAFALKFTGEGEIFYLQKRVGRNGQTFGLIKFATMVKNSANIGTGEITIKNDPRVLPLGRLLRKTKINELPQILNIIRGDMSIVGPRPMVPNTYAHYPESAQRIINTVKPGLTGVGSIIFRDEERLLDGIKDPELFYIENITPYKAELESWFVKNQNLLLYFKIILVTAWVIIFPNSKIFETVLKDLPSLPESLKL